ncbi:GNAT family N-acetyltransferase [Hafnia psychrotolerans]|jgi:putative acetyltransferase|uniref:N-acetyltransferase n=1 Tax=Hafnia psychrotolerans TaxID=1477018 RepID=A0ABQ1GYQ4_9GAMM|nr:GNAT family N-acetyltransferase [Hafnia psychrotolerans]GGA53193.1 N-acetyltransferase [Hafnia psychrotolerans]
MSLTIIPVALTDPKLKALVTELDHYQSALYPNGSDYSMPLEVMANSVTYPVLAVTEGQPVGCACLYLGNDGIAEIKRVYVAPNGRGKGVASRLIHSLEDHIKALKITAVYLETGIHQHDAIGLYKKHGFSLTGPFGHYANDPLSVFMVKTFSPAIAGA